MTNVKITELKSEVAGLDNPSARPPASAPKEAVQVVDRSKLLAAWESNIKTMQGVLEQLSFSQRTNMITRIATLLTLLLNVALFAFVLEQVSHMTSLVERIERQNTANREHVEQVIEESRPIKIEPFVQPYKPR